jgi:RNA polymerase sigma factor (sigma-70 family)
LAHLDPGLVRDLSARAKAGRWAVAPERFGVALARSLERAFPGESSPSAKEVETYLRALHLEDLAVACACEDGHEGAWEHFVREFRPQLYRAAGAIDPTGGARDLADALYADLFGLKERDGVRQSLFRYFHGRSSLGTWLRSVLSQRHVDRVRAERRLQPLPDENEAPREAPCTELPTPAALDRPRHIVALMTTLAAVIGRLAARDRLRLACYYAQNLTLAQIGRVTGEHEATVSRHLARTRRDVRRDVEQRLAREHGMAAPEIAECFAGAVADPGGMDLAELLDGPERKDSVPDRSK